MIPKKESTGGMVARKSTAVTGLDQNSFLNSKAHARRQNSKKKSTLYASSISSRAFMEIRPVYQGEMSSRYSASQPRRSHVVRLEEEGPEHDPAADDGPVSVAVDAAESVSQALSRSRGQSRLVLVFVAFG